jgi:hypothetical protein
MMMEAVRTSETSVDNHFTRQYNPEDSSEQLPSLLSRSAAEARRYKGLVVKIAQYRYICDFYT